MSNELEKLLAKITTQELETLLNQKKEVQIQADDRINYDSIVKYRKQIKANRERTNNSKVFGICGSCGQVVSDLEEVQ